MNTFRTASQPCATNTPEIGVPFTASCPSNIWACHPSKDQIEVSARQIWDSPDCLGLADEPPSTGVDQTTGIDITGSVCAIPNSPLDEAVSKRCVAVPGPTPFSSTACQEVPLGTVPVTRFLSQPTTSSVCEGSERGATKRLQNLWDESMDVALSLEALCLERPRKRLRVLASLPEESDAEREQSAPDVEGPLEVDTEVAEVVTVIVEAVAADVDPRDECPIEHDDPDVSRLSSQKTCRTQAVEADVAEEQTRLDKWMEPVPSRVDTEDDFTVFLSQQMAKARISDLRTFPASQPVTAGYMNRVLLRKDRFSCLSGLALPTEENDLFSGTHELSPASQPSKEPVEEVCEDPVNDDPLSPSKQPVTAGDNGHASVGKDLSLDLREATTPSQVLDKSAEICEDSESDDPLPPSDTVCLFATSPERDLYPERNLSQDRDLSPERCSSQDSVREDPVSPRTASRLAEVVSAALAAQCADRAPDRRDGGAGPCLPPVDARSQNPHALGRSDRVASEAEVEVDVEFEYSRADTVPCSPNGRPDFMTRTLALRTDSSETASQSEANARPGPSGYARKECLSGYGSAESYSDLAPMEGEEGGPPDDDIDDGTSPASPAAAGPDTQDDPSDYVGQPRSVSSTSHCGGGGGGRSASVSETPRSERSERSALSGYIGRLVDGLEESAALPEPQRDGTAASDELRRDGTAASNELWPDSGRSDSSHGNAPDADGETFPPAESPEPSQRTPLPSLSHAQRRELLQEIGLELVPDRGVVLHVTPAPSQEVEVAAAGSGHDRSPVGPIGTSRPAGTSRPSGDDDGSNGGGGGGDGAAQSTQLGSAPVSPEVGFSACCLSPVVSLPADAEEADADAEDAPPSLPSPPALGESALAEQDSVGDQSRPRPDSCSDVLNEARLLSLTAGSSDDRSPAAAGGGDDGDGESREGVSSESQNGTGEQEDNAEEEDEGIEESGGGSDLSEAQIESEQSQDGTEEESDCEITEYQSRSCKDAASQRHCEGAAGQNDCVVIEDQSVCVTADKRCSARRALVSPRDAAPPAVETATCTPVGRKLAVAATQTSPPHGLPEGVLALRPASEYVLDLPAAPTRVNGSLQSAAVGTAAPSRCCPAPDPEPAPTRVAAHSLVLRPASSADASQGDVPLGGAGKDLGRSHSVDQDAVATDSRPASAGGTRADRVESPGSPSRPCSAAQRRGTPIAGVTPASPSSPGGSAAVTGRSALDSPISGCATQPFRLSAALGPAGDGGWLSDGQEGRDGRRAQRGWSPDSPAAAAPAEDEDAEHHTPARSDSRSPATGPAVGGSAAAAAAVARGPSPAATASSRSPPAAAGRCDPWSVRAPSVAALPSGGGGGGGAVRPVTTGSAAWSDGRSPASGPQWAAVPAASETSRCGGLPDWSPAAGGGGSWEPRQPAEAAEPTAALGPSFTGGGPTSGADEPPEGARVPTAAVPPSGRPRTLRLGLSRRAQVTPLHRRPPY